MRVLAVDFGTSNTVAAVSIDGSPPRLLTIDGSPLVPSSIYLGEDGSIAVGRDADRQARLDPSRYEPNPKRRIDDGEMLLGTDVIPVRQAIAAVLGRVLQEFRRQFGNANPDVVRLTHPARWRQTRRDVLIAACKEAGLHDNPLLVPEPVGAATHFATQGGRKMPPGSALAVYDLGGGTFDVAIVQKRGDSFEVVAEAGLPDLGGLDFDHAILENIGKDHSETDPEAWEQLNRPTDTTSRRAQRALAVDIKEGKEALSRHPHTDIALPDPFSDAHLTRSEFEDMIRPNLARSVELLATTISEAKFTPNQLVGVYLVGGSSRVPLVARLIQEGMGITPTTLDQPESTVATGALYLNVGPRQGVSAPPARPGQGPPLQGPPNTGRQQRPLPAGTMARPNLPGNAPGGPVREATRRINPADLPNIRTFRPAAPPAPANIRRINAPPGPRQVAPPTGPSAARPPTGNQQRPPTGNQSRPPTAAQQRPTTNNQPRPPVANQPRPPTGGIPFAGATQPAGQHQPPSSPSPRMPQPGPSSQGPAQPVRSAPPAAASGRPGGPTGSGGIDPKVYIWIGIAIVAVALIVILLLNL